MDRNAHSMGTWPAPFPKGENQTQWSAAPMYIKPPFNSALQNETGDQQPNTPPPQTPREVVSMLALLEGRRAVLLQEPA